MIDSALQSRAARPNNRDARIGILVVAYNAATTLEATLDRIPKDFRHRIAEVFVCDDSSRDATYQVGLDYRQMTPDLPITVVRHTTNLGYGGNQKAGYRLAAQHDLDIVVLLHGDGQYAPELIPEIVAPLERGECDAVFGSRMMIKGAALAGGMPMYKLMGNRILTGIENRVLGSNLSEFHSGYRAYNVHALNELDLSATSDGFNFDTQIIIALLAHRMRIAEIPIPTYYGDEICYVNGMGYARDVLTDVALFRLAQMGFTDGRLVSVGQEYDLKESEGSSHSEILQLTEGQGPLLGCSGGLLAELLRKQRHHVTGVEMFETPATRERLDRFVQGDLENGIPSEVGGGFDVVIAADVLEHLRNGDDLLRQMAGVLAPGGRVLISVPNFGHWYPRLRTLFGVFDYDQRGILDRTHVRFFTRRSLLRSVKTTGFDVSQLHVTGLPIDVVGSRTGDAPASGTSVADSMKRMLRSIDRILTRTRPTLFGYQFVLELRPTSTRESIVYARNRDGEVDRGSAAPEYGLNTHLAS
jgi:SAM-dependent methyltransferase/GT2 family glycosyltransferase